MVNIVAKPKTAPVAPVARPAAPVVAAPAAVVEDATSADAAEATEEEAKSERKTRADFATHEDFCDYKIQVAEANVAKWQERVKLWQDKKVNKDADLAVKKAKKAEKLTAALIAVYRSMNIPEDVIQAKIAAFKVT